VTDPGVEDLLRELAPRVLGLLGRRYADFDGAEDAVQEALVAAYQHWPAEGVPDNPRAWLLQTATRRLIDAYRSNASRRAREERVFLEEPADEPDVVGDDDSLALLFLACHASLTPPSAIALTLRAVGGLTTAEIAEAFLVTEATMAQRISRAKATIRRAGARFETPTPEEQVERLPSVLRVLYLVFNEGYAGPTRDDGQRVALSREAIRLTRMVLRAVSHDAETEGLLALMLLLEARRPARVDEGGRFVPLADQDRDRWDRAAVAEGVAVLDAAIGSGRVGEYQLQAAIAAVHNRAASAEATDWPHILGLYDLLEKVTGNPVVTLNRAVAVAMALGPRVALDVVAEVEPQLPDHPRLYAVRGHLHELAGDLDAAYADLREAAARTTNRRERDHLLREAARLRPSRPADPVSFGAAKA
jgi:RNA polymerase sigma factor (sigma-70 family)